MRPTPQNRHWLASLILVAAAALAGFLAMHDDELSSSQVNIASAALKRHDPSQFTHDPIFGKLTQPGSQPTPSSPTGARRPLELWQFHTPAYQSMLELVLVPTEYRDLLLGFRVGAALQTLLFLAGMYALLFWQTRSWSVSTFTAVLAARLIETPGGAMWGAGTLSSVTPAGLCIAAWPLVVLTFARQSRPNSTNGPAAHWRIVLVFVVVGLLGNFHLVTAMNMTLVLLIAYVIRQRFSPRCLPIAMACGTAALLAALPYVWYYLSLRYQMSAGHPAPSAQTVKDAIKAGDLSAFYPDLLKALLDWRMLGGVIVLGIPAAAVLIKIERYITQNARLWLGLIIGSLVVSLGFHGASQAIGRLADSAPPVIDFVEAASLLMLPLYVLLGQAITNLFRILHGHRTALRWALTVLLGLWMVPADNLRVARWRLADLGTSFLSEEYKPDYVLRHREQENRAMELAAVAEYASGRSGAVFITDRSEFRVQARSAVAVGPDDVRYLYYLAPWRLGEWLDRYERQEALLSPPAGTADGQGIADFVEDLTRTHPGFASAKQWFVLLRASAAPAEPGPLQLVDLPQWGKHYKLYRVR